MENEIKEKEKQRNLKNNYEWKTGSKLNYN